MAHLATMNSLKGLYLENSKISDEGLASVSKLTDLETLNLARTHIGDAGLARLDGLIRLENLGLDGTRVTDAGLVRLLRGRTRFKGLYLSDTQIGAPTRSYSLDSCGINRCRRDSLVLPPTQACRSPGNLRRPTRKV